MSKDLQTMEFKFKSFHPGLSKTQKGAMMGEEKKPFGLKLLRKGKEGRKEFLRIAKEIHQRTNELFKIIDPYVNRDYALRRKVYNAFSRIYNEWDEMLKASPEEAVREFMREGMVNRALESFELHKHDREAFIENYRRKFEAIMEAYLIYVRDKFFRKYRDRIEEAMKDLIRDIFRALEELHKIELERKRKLKTPQTSR